MQERLVNQINVNIIASIDKIKEFFSNNERTRYIYAISQNEITRYLDKLNSILPSVLEDVNNLGYESYLFKILQSLQNLQMVLNQWDRVIEGDHSSENKVLQLYGSHLENARHGYKLTKRKLQRLEDLNLRLFNNQKKSENQAKKYLLLRDSLQKIACNEIYSVINPKILEQSEIIRSFIKLFLSPNILLEFSDIQQILWIQSSLISIINHSRIFAIDEYFKLLMLNVTSNLLCISHDNYAELVVSACNQLEIKAQISMEPDLYIGVIVDFFNNHTVIQEFFSQDEKDYQSSWLYTTTEKITKSLIQLLLYTPKEALNQFITEHINLFNTINGLSLGMNAWLQVYQNLEENKFKVQIGYNILTAIDLFLSNETHKCQKLLYEYIQSCDLEELQQIVNILSLKSNRILSVDFKLLVDIKYFFIPRVQQLFNVEYDCQLANEADRRNWATAWFYLSAYSLDQVEKIDTDQAIKIAKDIFPTFLRLCAVSSAAVQMFIDFFNIIAGYGNWQERHQIAKFLIDSIRELKHKPSPENLKLLQANAAIKLLELSSFIADIRVFKQLSSVYLLHFFQEKEIEKLCEINAALNNYRNILKFPLKENFDLLYYFSDELISFNIELNSNDGIWGMKLLYHIFDKVDLLEENITSYRAEVADLLRSVQRFSSFYYQQSSMMPLRILDGYNNFHLWELEIPVDYINATLSSYGKILFNIQETLINYKLLDLNGKIIIGEIDTKEANIELPACVDLAFLIGIKEQLFIAIVGQNANLGWQAFLMDQYLRIKDTVCEQILNGFKFLIDYRSIDLTNKISNAISIIDGARNYKFSVIDSVVKKYLEEGLSAAGIKEDLTLFFDAIVAAIIKVLASKSKSLEHWSMEASGIDDRIKFICARKKYSESQFKSWFLDINQQLSTEVTSSLLNKYLQDVRDLNEQHQSLYSSLGIDYFQYNQEIAIAAVYQYLEQAKASTNVKLNLFMKLGTGQGKSLVIAESARKILSEDLAKTVMVFTCYDHLAERDFNKFQDYFLQFGYKSVCILPCHLDSCTSIAGNDRIKVLMDFSKAQIIYANLKTYIFLLRQERLKRIKQQETTVVFPDLAGPFSEQSARL